jgi:hypothetical protein
MATRGGSLPNVHCKWAEDHQTMRSLDTAGEGSWQSFGQRDSLNRDYGSHALYDVGKILVAGGASSSNDARVIDLNEAMPQGSATAPMASGRRQHNLTVLADGTVLATGGNSSGAPSVDLDNGVYTAELWDPATGQWQTLAAMQVTRQYHSTALLLPDARVLSSGGGICSTCAISTPPAPIPSPSGPRTRPGTSTPPRLEFVHGPNRRGQHLGLDPRGHGRDRGQGQPGDHPSLRLDTAGDRLPQRRLHGLRPPHRRGLHPKRRLHRQLQRRRDHPDPGHLRRSNRQGGQLDRGQELAQRWGGQRRPDRWLEQGHPDRGDGRRRDEGDERKRPAPGSRPRLRHDAQLRRRERPGRRRQGQPRPAPKDPDSAVTNCETKTRQ